MSASEAYTKKPVIIPISFCRFSPEKNPEGQIGNLSTTMGYESYVSRRKMQTFVWSNSKLCITTARGRIKNNSFTNVRFFFSCRKIMKKREKLFNSCDFFFHFWRKCKSTTRADSILILFLCFDWEKNKKMVCWVEMHQLTSTSCFIIDDVKLFDKLPLPPT